MYIHKSTRAVGATSVQICLDGKPPVKVQVKKWGNSASVRIPASVMAAAALSIDQAVEIREEDGRVIIEPIRAPIFDLDQLLAQMTPETFHDDEDFGSPVGGEAW